MTLEQWIALKEAFDAIPEHEQNEALQKLAFRFFRQAAEEAERKEPAWAREIDESDGVQ